MRRALGVIALAVLTVACGSHRHAQVPRPFTNVPRLTMNPRELPPQPVLPPPASSFPKPPSYAASSCWTRAATGGPMREAPQVRPDLPHIPPETLLKQLRAHFGDASVIHAAQLGRVPPLTLRHSGYYGRGVRPPKDALWLYLRGDPSSPRVEWEERLFAGALRDELCLRRGRPLVGWSDGPIRMGLSDTAFPFGMQFPEPSSRVYRERVNAIAQAYGFRVASLRYLHALQPAPMLIVEANDRKKFALDAPAILERLDPVGGGAVTFEAFYFEARDAHGTFMRVFNTHRGSVMGGQWAWDERYLPYVHG